MPYCNDLIETPERIKDSHGLAVRVQRDHMGQAGQLGLLGVNDNDHAAIIIPACHQHLQEQANDSRGLAAAGLAAKQHRAGGGQVYICPLLDNQQRGPAGLEHTDFFHTKGATNLHVLQGKRHIAKGNI